MNQAFQRREHGVAKLHHSRAQNEDLEVASRDVPAHRRGAEFVVADRTYHASPGRMKRPFGEHEKHRQYRSEQPRVTELDGNGGGDLEIHSKIRGKRLEF